MNTENKDNLKPEDDGREPEEGQRMIFPFDLDRDRGEDMPIDDASNEAASESQPAADEEVVANDEFAGEMDLEDDLRDDEDLTMLFQDYAEQSDEEMEDLLDEALGEVEVPGYLSEMIIERTIPSFERKRYEIKPRYRMSPAVIRAVAAVFAFAVLGVVMWSISKNLDWDQMRNGVDRNGVQMAGVRDGESEEEAISRIESQLAALPVLQGETQLNVSNVDDAEYDEMMQSQLDLVALQMQMAEADENPTDSAEAMELAVMEYELAEMMNTNEFYF